MRITVNLNGQDVALFDVLKLVNLMNFQGRVTFNPVAGSVVVAHSESEGKRLTEKYIVEKDEQEELNYAKQPTGS